MGAVEIDVQAYLERIAFPGRPEVDLATLAALQRWTEAPFATRLIPTVIKSAGSAGYTRQSSGVTGSLS